MGESLFKKEKGGEGGWGRHDPKNLYSKPSLHGEWYKLNFLKLFRKHFVVTNKPVFSICVVQLVYAILYYRKTRSNKLLCIAFLLLAWAITIDVINTGAYTYSWGNVFQRWEPQKWIWLSGVVAQLSYAFCSHEWGFTG